MSDFTRPEGFTGYRMDLEDKEFITENSSPYMELMRGPDEYQESNVYEWWHVRNQKTKGSCRGHSLAANGRFAHVLQAGEIDLDGDGVSNEANLQDDFSPDFAYYECQRQDGIRGDNGATIKGGIPVGLNGLAREVDLPYTTDYAPQRVTAEIREKAKQFKFGRYSEITSPSMGMDWLGAGQGGLDWGTVWPLPFVKGCLVKGMSKAAVGGGHATAPLGMIRGETLMRLVPTLKGEVRSDEWVLTVANSHSEHAQWRGFFFVTAEGLADILAHRWTTAIGWSDLNVPRKRKFDFRKFSVFG